MNIKQTILLWITLITAASFAQAQLDRSVMPVPGPAPEINLQDPQTFVLENGLRVFVVENRKLPRVAFSLFVDRDPLLEKNIAGYLSAAGELLRAGTYNRSKQQIDEAIDFMGASFFSSSQSLYAASLKKHTDSLLTLVSEMIMQPAFPEAELEKIRTQAISRLELRGNNPNSIAGYIGDALTYGTDHPYGEFQTERSWKRLSLNDCRDYYKKYFRPNIAYLAMVGDLDLKEAKRLARQYFGEWRSEEVPQHTYDLPQAPQRPQVALVDQPKAVQSIIQVRYPLDLKPGDPDFFPLKIAVAILGSGASSRLFRNLREKHGWTYTAGAGFEQDPLVGSFQAGTSVRNAVTDSAVAEILKEMERLREEPVTEEDLRITRNSLIGEFIRDLESPQTLASFAIQKERFELPDRYFKDYLKKLQAVTIEDVQRVARAYIRPANALILVVGKAEEVAEKLERFGALTYYDLNARPYDPNAREIPIGMTSKEVIEAYLKALGGREALENIKDVKRVYKGQILDQEMQLSMLQKAPNLLRQQFTAPGFSRETVFDGEEGFERNAAGQQALAGASLDRMKVEATLFPQLAYAELGYKTRLLQLMDLEGTAAYKVEVTDPNGEVSHHFFSEDSGLLLETHSTVETPSGQRFSQVYQILEYVEKEGVKFPSKIRQLAGSQVLELKLEEIAVNAKLKKSDFQE
jgi:zinc protease